MNMPTEIMYFLKYIISYVFPYGCLKERWSKRKKVLEINCFNTLFLKKKQLNIMLGKYLKTGPENNVGDNDLA